MSKQIIAYGIFTWAASERQSNRYGGFFLDGTDYKEIVTVHPYVKRETYASLIGKRVKVTCVVEESRDSGHIGDLALGLTPSRPETGESVNLGVGYLRMETLDFTTSPDFLLVPDDGRDELWIDPRKLYRLHDQTVTVYAEETEDACSPVANLVAESGVVATGDGGFQSKRINLNDKKIAPVVEKLGDGLFSMVFPDKFDIGEKVTLISDGEH